MDAALQHTRPICKIGLSCPTTYKVHLLRIHSAETNDSFCAISKKLNPSFMSLGRNGAGVYTSDVNIALMWGQ